MHLPKLANEKYGLIGWKEFHHTRTEILDEFHRAKGYNVSRPVKVAHGIAGEAALRKWLSGYLPKKFGVTSGYVIPDVMAIEYKLYHFDVIIYDAANSPVLWIDGDCDRSEQGKKRAIPAKHVHAVLEAKASLTGRTARDAIAKLNQLAEVASHLPNNFSCGAFFFDLDPMLANNQNILPHLIPSATIAGYWGGLILHCSLNDEMTGLIEMMKLPDNKEEAKSLNIPIVKDIDQLNIRRDKDGNVTIGEQGAGVMAFGGPDKKWHFSKLYGPIIYGEKYGLHLAWSHNGFATFALDLLSRLEGITPKQDRKYIFGQIFDVIS